MSGKTVNSAILLLVIGNAMAILSDVFIKLLDPGAPVFQFAFLRCVLTLVFLLPLARKLDRSNLLGGLKVHAIRAHIHLVGIVCMVVALTNLPLATANAVFYAAPILVMALVPWLDTSRVRSGRYRPQFKWWFWLLVIDFIALMWLGAMPAEEPYASFSLIASAYWFAYFLVILPLLGVIEKPAPQPETIEADFDAHYAPKTGGTKTLVKPAE